MNWFRENRFIGRFFIAFGVTLLLALWFLFSAKSGWNEASSRFRNAATELNRLERLAPYPSADNLRKMKVHAEDYSASRAKLKAELKRRATAPSPPMAPNEFQSRLRLALNAVTEKARANKVKLPDKFYLGFDDYVSALPIESAAPSLGHELTQIEWLVNNLLDARVDALIAFRRAPLFEENNSSAAGAPDKLFQRGVVEATFSSTPGAARTVINQIAAATQPFCIIRLLHVRNENDKGPPRDVAADTSTATKTRPAAALNFIVGNEKIETTATIEIVRFTL
ncbi:MAG: Amuc_1100 family pilus-like protein [Chthoniobacterales bacterium]